MDWVDRAAVTGPQHPALMRGDRTISYAELHEMVARVGGALTGAGVRSGDRVAVAAVPGPAVVAAMWAVPRAGAVLVPLPAAASPDRAGMLEAAGVRLALASERVGEVPTLDPEVAAASGVAAVGEPAGPDHPYGVFFTSGSSGAPKGAILTHGNLEAAAAAAGSRIPVATSDVWLAVLPLHHVGGYSILYRCWRAGAAVMLEERFDPARVAGLLDTVTLVSLVPTMLARLLDAGAEGRPELRVLVGGAPLAPALAERAAAAGLALAPTYGMTETASQVATAAPAASPQVALPLLEGVEVRITAPGGGTVEAGEVGAIEVRGPMVSPGYWRGEQRPADGWFRSGDLGRLHEAGLEVVGRADDAVITGGEVVHPAAVEAVLESHPAVAAVAVAGRPDPEWGELVVAVVVAAGAAPGLEELRRFAAGRLARHQVPKEWRFVAGLPRTSAGKIDRAAVAALVAGPAVGGDQ